MGNAPFGRAFERGVRRVGNALFERAFERGARRVIRSTTSQRSAHVGRVGRRHARGALHTSFALRAQFALRTSFVCAFAFTSSTKHPHKAEILAKRGGRYDKKEQKLAPFAVVLIFYILCCKISISAIYTKTAPIFCA